MMPSARTYVRPQYLLVASVVARLDKERDRSLGGRSALTHSIDRINRIAPVASQ